MRTDILRLVDTDVYTHLRGNISVIKVLDTTHLLFQQRGVPILTVIHDRTSGEATIEVRAHPFRMHSSIAHVLKLVFAYTDTDYRVQAVGKIDVQVGLYSEYRYDWVYMTLKDDTVYSLGVLNDTPTNA